MNAVPDVPPTTISDELVRIAAEAMRANGVPPGVLFYDNAARIAAAAVVPYIEAGLREQIAAEIEAAAPRLDVLVAEGAGPARRNRAQVRRDSYFTAARVARGTTAGEA